MINCLAHHFVSKQQSKFLRQLKDNLGDDECIIQCDFAENFAPVIQDAIQSVHWTNIQTALHTSVTYLKVNGVLIHRNQCVISDCLTKNSSTVHALLTPVLDRIKEQYSHIKKVHYFTDGSAAQYKNRFNLGNLCFHKIDRKLDANWHFFATSHGKSACDGIGGATKRLARLWNLRAVDKNPVVYPIELFEWAKTNISNIEYFFVSKEQVERVEKELHSRFESCLPMKNVKKHHRFCPIDSNKIRMFKISSATESSIVQVFILILATIFYITIF